MKLPTLYKRTSTGALQEWTVIVDGWKYYTQFGQVGGAIQESAPVVCSKKNLGRANETTAEEQAELEAQALWIKKQKKDYTLDPNVKVGQTSDLIEGGILPMLANKFSEHGDKLKYPCFVQPKLDGHRCISDSDGLWSRTRKPIKSVPHIREDCMQATDNGTPLDGELYNHEYRDKFEQLTHFIRQSAPEAGCEAVQYHIYDSPGPGTFRQRWNMLQMVFKGNRDLFKEGSLRLVETREVQNEDELMLAFEDFLAQGYEGAVARNADGLYVNKRSYDLLKIKKFDDAEFKCVEVDEGQGKMKGHAVFVCVTEDGTEFGAKLIGDHDALARYYKHPELVVGKIVTVKYQGLTNKNGVPRFPVALRIREAV